MLKQERDFKAVHAYAISNDPPHGSAAARAATPGRAISLHPRRRPA